MATYRFPTFQEYNEAKQLPLTTIVIGDPIYERDENGLLTGAFLVDTITTQAQHEELASHGLLPYNP